MKAKRELTNRLRAVLLILIVAQSLALRRMSTSARLWIVGCGIALIAVVIAGGRRAAREAASEMPPVSLPDVPRVVRMLREAGREGAFVVLLFGKDGAPPAASEALNVQFSVEKGRVGLDWILASPLNVAEETRVLEFFGREGRPVETRSKNGISYLRIEDGDLAALCEVLLARLFGVSAEQKLTLIAEGVSWRGPFILEATT